MTLGGGDNNNTIGKPLLFSIVMPCFNSSATIERSIESVLRQSYVNWELLVVDDGSTDDTHEIVKEICLFEARVKILKNEFSKGAAGARKTAVKYSAGQFIAFLDSDDIWSQDHLLGADKFFNSKPDANFIFSNYTAVSGAKQVSYFLPDQVGYGRFLCTNFVPCLTVVLRAAKVDWRDMPEIRKRNDLAIWLTLVKKYNEPFFNTGLSTGFYSVSKTGLSGSYLESYGYAVKVLQEYGGLSLFAAVNFSLMHAVIAVLKKIFPVLFNKMCRTLV